MGLEDRAVLRLALGDHGTVAAELESLTAAYPMRERLWGLRAVALARAGRQADALDALREVREVLDRELGLEPSAQLRDLQTAVLRQDPALSRGDAVAAPAAPLPTARPRRRGCRTGRWSAATTSWRSWSTRLPPRSRARRASLRSPGSRASASRGCAASWRPAPRRTAPGSWWAGARRTTARPVVAVAAGAAAAWGPSSPYRDADDEGAEFRTWEAITDRVAEAARRETVVVVLDDLHWADRSSLRVLRLLADTVDDRSPADPRHLAHPSGARPAPSPTRRSRWPGGTRPGWTCTASPRPRRPRWSRPSRR